MPRILITSAGTLGDFLPFIALGQALKARGHSVRLAFNSAMHPLGRKAGLDCVPCGAVFGPRQARTRAEVFDYWHDIPLRRCLHYYRLQNLPRTCRDLLSACRDADLLIASNVQGAAHLVVEKTGIPWLSVSLQPLEFFTKHENARSASAATHSKEVKAERVLRGLTNELRISLGLSPHALDDWLPPREPDRLLLAYSRHFNTGQYTEPPPTRQTGFWFYDGDAAGPCKPSSELRAFVRHGPPPLVLSLSSQPVKNPERTLAVHVKAAIRLGARLVVQCGWAGFKAKRLPPGIDSDQVFFAEHLPHDWLFPRAAALIHHGGIGTTARALRHGLPMLVEPYGNDQFDNASRILALGVGAAMHPHKLTTEGLSRIIAERVLQPAYRKRAQSVAAKLRKENGIQEACALVEQMLKGREWGCL